jgi:cytochrome c oxidase subunit 2
MEEVQLTSRRRSLTGIFLALAIAAVPLLAILYATRTQLPLVASLHGRGIDSMINYTLITVGVVFIVAHLIFAYFVWRFSRQDQVTSRMVSRKAEWRWALIPVIVMILVAEGGVLVIGMPVWRELYSATESDNVVTVEVTAEQFAWNVRYPGKDGVFGKTSPMLIEQAVNPLGVDAADPNAKDDLYLGPELKLPVNRPVRILLRSKDVLHSFFLPHQRIKQDAVPGMVVEVRFVPTEVGEFEIACTELCGLGHYKMRGILTVMPQEEFERWYSASTDFYFPGE